MRFVLDEYLMGVGRLVSWFCIIIITVFSTVSSAAGLFHNEAEADTIIKDNLQKDELALLELKKGFYCVIGVFDYKLNASRFTDLAQANGLTSAKYGYVVEVKRYYVYTTASEDYEATKAQRGIIRSNKDYKDAWILKYQMDNNALPTIVSSNKASSSLVQKATANGAATVQSTSLASGSNVSEISSAPTVTPSLYKTYNLLVKVTSDRSGKSVPGPVKLINTEKAKLLASIEANTPVTLNLPANENQNVEFVVDAFGYEKLSMHVNLQSLKAGDSIGNNVSKYSDTVLVNLRLKPYKTGDVIVLYNVYFFDNSSVIRPVSKSQLNTVYEMLNENKNMQVNIHGHTNGDDHGEIIKMAESDTSFFQVTPKNIRTNGSAYALSNERALTIKRWLVYKGIDAKRLDTKAWGGKKRLYDHPLDFGKNIRVELEVMKDLK